MFYSLNKSIFISNKYDWYRFSTCCRQKALYNLDLLITNNKSSHWVHALKMDLANTDNKININYINESITKIYLSYSIHEALHVLKNKNVDNSLLLKYEFKYQNAYKNNNELLYLFKSIENDIKEEYKTRDVFNLLPFFYKIYLNESK
jgi:hypothetical protein